MHIREETSRASGQLADCTAEWTLKVKELALHSVYTEKFGNCAAIVERALERGRMYTKYMYSSRRHTILRAGQTMAANPQGREQKRPIADTPPSNIEVSLFYKFTSSIGCLTMICLVARIILGNMRATC